MQFDPRRNELPLTQDVPVDRSIAIKVVGVGGAGSNTVGRLAVENLERVQLAVVNTDLQALGTSPVREKALIGAAVTRGLGAGGDPDLGRAAAEADRQTIAALVKDSDLLFLAAGMGGGTGGGAAPVIAEAAAEQGALVIAFVSLPFSFEGGRRARQAEEGLVALRRVCDAVVPLPNDLLLQACEDQTGVREALARGDEWIARGVASIWAMLFRNGLINLDFSTLQQAFQSRGGKAFFGLGSGEGPEAVTRAVASLRACPLWQATDYSRRPDRLLVNIVGGADLTLPMVNELMTGVTDFCGRESHVIMGAVIDERLRQRVEVCVLGTTDVGGRSFAQRRAQAGARAAAVHGAKAPGPAEAPVAVAAQPVEQDEFSFNEVASRGYFDKTDRNLFEGQDLDVPAYLRKGIKITP